MSEEETIEVDLGTGTKVSMPKEDGLRYIASRDEKAKAFNALQAQVTTREAAEKASLEKAQQEEEKRIAIEAAQKGELDLLNNHHAAQLIKRDSEILSVSIQAELAARTDIVASALPDATTMLANGGELTWENGAAVHKAADGSVQTLKTFVDSWIESRPHYRNSNLQKKAGGDGNPQPPAGVDVISRSEYDTNPTKYLQQIAAGKLIVKD